MKVWILYLRDAEAWQFANVRGIKKRRQQTKASDQFSDIRRSFLLLFSRKAKCQTISTRWNIFSRSRGKAWISLTGFTRARYHPTSCSNNSFSTGHKCRSSKVNIRLSIDGFHDREGFYRRRTRTCRLLLVFGVFNGPSARPDLRRFSFSRAAKLPSLVERLRGREGKKERVGFTSVSRVVSLRVQRSFRCEKPTATTHFRLRVYTLVDRISHLITRKSHRFRATYRGENENIVTALRRD